MEINLAEPLAELQAAFDRYEAALMANDVAGLDALFAPGPHTIRYGIAENLYGSDEILAFRQARSPVGLARTLSRTVHHHLWPRVRHRVDAVSPPVRAGQSRAADADLGPFRRWVARGRRPCEPDPGLRR